MSLTRKDRLYIYLNKTSPTTRSRKQLSYSGWWDALHILRLCRNPNLEVRDPANLRGRLQANQRGDRCQEERGPQTGGEIYNNHLLIAANL